VHVAAGFYIEDTIEAQTDLSILLADGAHLRAPVSDAFVIREGVHLTLIGGSVDAPKSRAFDCSSSSLTLRGTNISAEEFAIHGLECAFEIDGADIHSAEYGIEIYGGSLRVVRSRLHNHSHGTLFAWNANLIIENNFIVENNQVSGGYSVYLEAAHGGSRFRYNTIANNSVESSTYPAVLCMGFATEAGGNIVWNDNGRSLSGSTCTWNDSNLRDGSIHGLLDGVYPEFVAPDEGDYRLAASSPLIDSSTGPSVEEDHFGTPRPVGAATDIGAHERTN